MPSCVIKGCSNTWNVKEKTVIMHAFPNDAVKIKHWLSQAPDHFSNIDEWVQKILIGKKNDKYRICSKHFEISAYDPKSIRKRLLPDAVPTIFPTKEKKKDSTTSCEESFEASACSQECSNDTTADVQSSTSVEFEESLRKRKRIDKIPRSTDTDTDSIPTTSTFQAAQKIYLPPRNMITFSYISSLSVPHLSNTVGPKKIDQSTNTDVYWDNFQKSLVLNTSLDEKKSVGVQTLKPNNKNRGTMCRRLIDPRQKSKFFPIKRKKKKKAKKNKKEEKKQPTAKYDPQKKHTKTSGFYDPEQETLDLNILDSQRTPQDIGPVMTTDHNKETLHSRSSLLNLSEDYDVPTISTDTVDHESTKGIVFSSTPQKNPIQKNFVQLFELSPLQSTSIRDVSKIKLVSKRNLNFDKHTDCTVDSENEEDAEFDQFGAGTDDEEEIESFSDEMEEEELTEDTATVSESNFFPLDSESPGPVKDEKYIVFQTSLKKLISLVLCQYRNTCGAKLLYFRISKIGSAIIVEVKCTKGHEQKLWTSQPKIKRLYVGNLLLSSAVLLSGNNFQKIANFFQLLQLSMISKATYYRHQLKYIFPIINLEWENEKQSIKRSIGSRSVCLAGDGQADSPGFSAKYSIYTFLDTETNKIVDFSIEQLTPTETSVNLEKKAFKKTLERIMKNNINVRIIATDRHVGIRKILKEDYPKIKHQFDVWHMAKSFGQKLLTASKNKNCAELSAWISPIKNHLWWCARTCEEDPDLLLEKWKSVLKHVVNVHKWSNGGPYSQCYHLPIDQDSKWLKEDSVAFEKLKAVVENQMLLRDMRHLSMFCHTGVLEVYHSSTLKYRPKRVHFYFDGMVARTTLAALDHNNNVGRVQAAMVIFDGGFENVKKKYRVEYSKARKAWVVKLLYEPKSNDFLIPILKKILEFANGEIDTYWESSLPTLPRNIASISKPDKEELIERFLTRF